MEQICKTKKIRKKFVSLLNFCMGRCGIRSCRFSQRFKQISKHELAISLAVSKQSNLYTFKSSNLEFTRCCFSEYVFSYIIESNCLSMGLDLIQQLYKFCKISWGAHPYVKSLGELRSPSTMLYNYDSLPPEVSI